MRFWVNYDTGNEQHISSRAGDVRSARLTGLIIGSSANRISAASSMLMTQTGPPRQCSSAQEERRVHLRCSKHGSVLSLFDLQHFTQGMHNATCLPSGCVSHFLCQGYDNAGSAHHGSAPLGSHSLRSLSGIGSAASMYGSVPRWVMLFRALCSSICSRSSLRPGAACAAQSGSL